MDSAISTAMTTALTTVQGNVLGAIALVAPLALAVMGAFLAWRYGIRFFKGLSK